MLIELYTAVATMARAMGASAGDFWTEDNGIKDAEIIGTSIDNFRSKRHENKKDRASGRLASLLCHI